MPTSTPYTGPIFDVQAHAITPSSYPPIATAIRTNPHLEQATASTIADDICVQLADDLQGAARRQALGETGIQVITINAFFPPSLPADILLRILTDTNSWMATQTAASPQLIGIASMPPAPVLAAAGLAPDNEPYTQKALAHLRHALTTLNLRGLMFASNYNGIFLGDPSYDPYFALVADLNVPVIIHPAVEPVETPHIARKNIPTYSGFLNDQRTALLDLVLSGVYEKYPNLIIIATHLGGGILTSLGRFRELAKRFPADAFYVDREGEKRLLPLSVPEYLKKVYFDCNNADEVDIRHAAEVVGYGHLLTGTDFPWTDDRFTREVLGEVEEGVRADLAWNNAAGLFGVEGLVG
ncbi:amidohydrolase 2 [Aspergillus ellipticus CBS 707.79]|uniref:Amidohydrolase 2 n=1 Tax=Aspergillus ellipticus CBS 707.79 TaxID=1448320 RepID=A0A319CUG9_9EURO|nr:amidohydrolase 2 [Aspergillus ellipticus CBS 707.79]